MATIQERMTVALQHHQQGQLQTAEQLYRDVLAYDPRHAGALHYLGVIAHQTGNNQAALDTIRRSLAIDPQNAEAHNNLRCSPLNGFESPC